MFRNNADLYTGGNILCSFFSVCVRIYWEGEKYLALSKLKILRDFTHVVSKKRDILKTKVIAIEEE